MWSNMFPNPSDSVFSNDRSESNSLGGVAVLAVLSVTVLFLLLFTSGGRVASGEVGEPRLPLTTPKEKVLAGLRRNPGRADGAGGTGMSL
jgi:hypothetical protein